MVKKIVGILVALVIITLMALIIKNVFGSSDSSRVKNADNYKLTNNEKNSVKDKLEEIENVESVKIYTNVKIIKIIIVLSEDTPFDTVKSVCNEALSNFSEKNLEYYDVEVYVKCNAESETYPKIGYKHKSKEKFKW